MPLLHKKFRWKVIIPSRGRGFPSLGIDLLPQTMGEALQALRKDEILLAAMGEPLARSFVAVRQNEWDNLNVLCRIL